MKAAEHCRTPKRGRHSTRVSGACVLECGAAAPLSAAACVLKWAADLASKRNENFREMKQRGEKIIALTAYDYPTARLLDESGIDIILVGDSVGMVVLGYQDTTDVTLDEMFITRARRRGVKQALLVADMPIHTYDTPVQAAETAKKFSMPARRR